MKGVDFKKWELLVLVLAIALFGGSSFLYFSGISIRKHLLGFEENQESIPVGRLSTVTGSVRRQMARKAEFETIDASMPLYNFDTLVTGADSGATIELDGGGKIELGPSTMVKLVFEASLSLQGISRAANVEVVQGAVSGQAADTKTTVTIRAQDRVIPLTSVKQETVRIASVPLVKKTPRPQPIPVDVAPVAIASPSPSPRPSPLLLPPPLPPLPPPAPRHRLEVVSPANGARIVVPENSEKPEVPVTFEWKIDPLDTKVKVVLRKIGTGKPDSPDVEILNRAVAAVNGVGRTEKVLELPGVYEWEIRQEDGSPFPESRARSRFAVPPEYYAVRPLPPLVGGKTIASNAYRGEHASDFGVTFHWKPFPKAEGYMIRIFSSADATKPLLERTIEDEKYSFNKDKVFSGKIYYAVSAILKSGFRPGMRPELFNFSFLPPNPVMPEDKATVSLRGSASGDGSILLTWQKTNFTQGYELQVGRDPEFNQTLLTRKVKENFLVLKPPGPGRFWWRVRSFSKDVASPFSRPFELIVNR